MDVLSHFVPNVKIQTPRQLRTALLRWDTRHFGFYLKYLRSRNNSSTRPIISEGGPIVSLTTYGLRMNSVYLTLESIGAQTLLPAKVLLWVDKPFDRAALPESLSRLESRGLEIRETLGFGPHTKYYPYVQTAADLDQPLVIADDDLIYPSYWLAELAKAYCEAPDCVNCHRAHAIQLNGSGISRYLKWKACTSSAPSFLHFATGVSGSILPPQLLKRLRQQGPEFADFCPTADDIWLHVNAVRSNLRTRQIKPWQSNFPEIPGTQQGTLSQLNVSNSQNDVQIANTYNILDLACLTSEAKRNDTSDSGTD